VGFLTPLFHEADDAHRTFKAHWSGQTHRPDWEEFKNTEAYRKLLDRFWASQRSLDDAILPAIESLRAGKAEAIDRALAYLSIRLRPHRSGYICTRIARALRHAPLDERHLHHLRRILLDRITWPWASVGDLWKWIPRVRTPDFDHALQLLCNHDSAWVSTRATRLAKNYLGC
jgi:hypothetical protein